jgi:hypothetical protein
MVAQTMQLLKKYCTFLLLAESSACFTKAVPSFVTCCKEKVSEHADRFKDYGRVQDNEAFCNVNPYRFKHVRNRFQTTGDFREKSEHPRKILNL